MHEGIRAERVKDSIVKGNFALQFSRGNDDVYLTTLRRGPLLCAHLNFGDQKTGVPRFAAQTEIELTSSNFNPNSTNTSSWRANCSRNSLIFSWLDWT